jgi:hypothetical protein
MLGLGNSIISGGVAEEFLPTQVNNLKLWLQNGVGVTAAQWDDSSGNSNHAVQGTAGNQATVDGGGLEFDGSDDHYDIGDPVVGIEISDEESLTIFVVVELDNVDKDTILGIDAAGDFFEVQTQKRLRLNFDSGGSLQINFASNQFINDEKHLITIERESGGTGNVNIFKNGSLLSPDSQLSSAAGITFKTIGSRGVDRFLGGHIYELLVYDTADLTSDEMSSVNNYLTSKFGL